LMVDNLLDSLFDCALSCKTVLLAMGGTNSRLAQLADDGERYYGLENVKSLLFINSIWIIMKSFFN
jgi:uncharacterized membrane protein YjjP (DUF1212 family)